MKQNKTYILSNVDKGIFGSSDLNKMEFFIKLDSGTATKITKES